MDRIELYSKILLNLGMIKDEVGSFEQDLIDEIIEMISLLVSEDKEQNLLENDKK